MKQPTEKLLIQTYTHINESRNLIEQLINQFGQEQSNLSSTSEPISSLPQDIQHLVEVALQLSPSQRHALKLFLDSLKNE
ncbi:hypothetical protein IC620_01185 [Hazenella sp. IB182357]|uniref:Uncharacterized protein n=1 Tax=Polycladospora coralii TaxID=2771432 RepID=A0A926N5K7_9BACL|nr:hypothetical protein [Polycladospora coralii]MBD1370976.1 hypothetical protein [Polycladospora coralii]MBS7529915.1 hypothetical protein [Polycladospora coralii]